MALMSFEWDLHNVGHVARHGVDPAEVEEAVDARRKSRSVGSHGDE